MSKDKSRKTEKKSGKKSEKKEEKITIRHMVSNVLYMVK